MRKEEWRVWCGEILEKKQLEEKDDENREWKTERFKVVTKNYVCSIFRKRGGRLMMKEMCDSKKLSQCEISGQSEHSVSDEDVDSLSVWRQEDKNIAFFEFWGLSSSYISRRFEQKSRIIECWAIKKKGKSFQRCRSYAHFASFDIYINLFLLSFHVFHFSSLSLSLRLGAAEQVTWKNHISQHPHISVNSINLRRLSANVTVETPKTWARGTAAREKKRTSRTTSTTSEEAAEQEKGRAKREMRDG